MAANEVGTTSSMYDPIRIFDTISWCGCTRRRDTTTKLRLSEKDPSGLKYLREFPLSTQKREGLPGRETRPYIVYGYTNAAADAPTDADGCVRKRMFVLKPKDHGGPENDGEYWAGPETPAETVEISSIRAGAPSTPMQP